MANDNIHAGHRERLRKKFLADSKSLENHEILELLLTYTIPRHDTNKLAHTLIRRFKSFDGILSADPDELLSVEEFGPKSLFLIQLISEFESRRECERHPRREVYNTEERIGELLLKKYKGIKRETSYAILFDGKHCILGFILLGMGTVNSSVLDIRSVVQPALRKNACSVAVAHNHPGGLAYPSESDRRVTDDLRTALELVGIDFDGHYILSDTDWYVIF